MGCSLGSTKEQQAQAAAAERRHAVEKSPPLLLQDTTHGALRCEVQCFEAQTALELLESIAGDYGLPRPAAAWLQVEFAGVTVEHSCTLKGAGLCDHAEFSVEGVEEALAKLPRMEFWDAVAWSCGREGDPEELRKVLALYPEKANERSQVAFIFVW